MKDFEKFSLMKENETTTSDSTKPLNILRKKFNKDALQFQLWSETLTIQAMEEYAKQTSIGFAEWIAKKYQPIFNFGLHKVWILKDAQEDYEKHTTKELFELFLKEL